MLLTPAHFLQQEEFIAETAEWSLRYLQSGVGLVGSGARGALANGAGDGFDPQIALDPEGGALRLSVTRVRGITPSGRIIEISPPDVLEHVLAGDLPQETTDVYLWVVHTGARVEDPASRGSDPANATAAAYRRPGYAIKTTLRAEDLLSEAPNALVIARLRRAGPAADLRRDDTFIPQCVSMRGHGRLLEAWTATQRELAHCLDAALELHGSSASFIAAIESGGVYSRFERDLLAFANTVALAAQSCLHDTADPVMAPRDFFGRIDQLRQRVNLALQFIAGDSRFEKIVPEVRSPSGDHLADHAAPVTEWRTALSRQDLAEPVRAARGVVSFVRELTGQIAERYREYRTNRALASLPVLLGENGQIYLPLATAQRTDQQGDARAFLFTELPREEKPGYLAVILGNRADPPPWSPGDHLPVHVAVNWAAGGARGLITQVTCETAQQRNFALTIPTPADAGMSSLRLELPQRGGAFESAVLYGLKTEADPTAPQPKRDPADAERKERGGRAKIIADVETAARGDKGGRGR
jgi:hypothetical protein